MAKSQRPSKSPGEKARFEVLLEEVNSKFDLVLDGIQELRDRMERLELRVGAIESRMEHLELQVGALESAVSIHTKEIQQLQKDVRSLTERFDEHLKAHAT